MKENFYPNSQIPIRRTSDFLPEIFRTESNEKFLNGSLDALVQPGTLEKVTGYIGRRYGKTYRPQDIYLDSDESLRSKYQLEPAVVVRHNEKTKSFYDFLDFKNQLRFFGNLSDRDDKIAAQSSYTWNPPIDWDKFVNYREYYWEPLFPPSLLVRGNAVDIASTFRVSQGVGPTWIFSPDGFSNNPTIKLFRGQTYRFKINSPQEGFVIRSNYSTGGMRYDPTRSYLRNQMVLFDNKLWKALNDIPAGDGSTIDLDSQDWQLVETIVPTETFDYNKGVANNGATKGEIIFEVPYDAPDILFYQSAVSPDRLGNFIVEDIEENTFIDIEKEILGKITYKSSNGIEFSNGLAVEFSGQVVPEKYASGTWIVEGVGDFIKLINVQDLVIPPINAESPSVLFDGQNFDTVPFDDAVSYPGTKDYITISRDSKDLNPWSRYNRWFHRSVLEFAYKSRGSDFPANEKLRAKRPIIEFLADLQLANHGTQARPSLDLIDDFTTDIFSTIEGSKGYNIDGEFLFEGARVLFTADTDILANNKIYTVTFITHKNNRQIHLVEDTTPNKLGDCVLVKRGKNNSGLMYHFDGSTWAKSQTKTKVNQSPLFDIFDENGTSFLNKEFYPISDFSGSTIFSYRIGNSIIDQELGFSLSYLNIDNIGDIQFEWKLDKEIFTYLKDRQQKTGRLASGFYKFNNEKSFQNGWTDLDPTFLQPLIETIDITADTDSFESSIIEWNDINVQKIEFLNFYINNKKYQGGYSRVGNTITIEQNLRPGDFVTLKLIGDISPDRGYYEIPSGLEKNPLNLDLELCSFGEVVDHVSSSLEFDQQFQGLIPGVSNLRDLTDYRDKCKRFIKHSGLSPLAIFLVCDKKFNLVNAIRYSQRSYNEFKNNVINKSLTLPFNESVPDFLDEIINDLSKTKNLDSPFADSDMIGNGAYTAITYKVEEPEIKTFSMSRQFDLDTLSRQAVYVYLNHNQLLFGRDYSFNSTFGFLTIDVELQENDLVEIREYVTTSGNYIPPTPTKLGILKKYTPSKFVDDRYLEPREVIQGHDGSITVCYGDYRDDLLLELEFRIYNNIKTNYQSDIFDVDSVLGGYYGNSEYKIKEIDPIIQTDFLRWLSNTDIDYITNEYFEDTNTFTYTYSSLLDPTGTENLQGWWRGIYRYFYDTDRPHSHPWEMLGFTEKPNWWDSQYGPAPYTSNNLLLWEDIRDGIIRQGDKAGTYPRYQRSSILNYLPVDGRGNLLSPLQSGLSSNFLLYNNKGSFVFGDQGPIETTWRNSSDYQFSLLIALCLIKPFQFVSRNFNRAVFRKNLIGQNVTVNDSQFLNLNDLAVDNNDIKTGLVNYLVDYVKHLSLGITEFDRELAAIDVSLTSRLGGFVDKGQQKYLLDSKNPQASTSSVFVPPENYEIFFNVSAPIQVIAYSGVVIEKTEFGFSIRGYDKNNPYFNYFEVIPAQSDPLLVVGGVTPDFIEWSAGRNYVNGELIRYREEFYRCIRSHTAGDNFAIQFWTKVPNLPLTGGVEAFKRRNFRRIESLRLGYGTVLPNVQAVVDFLLGYEQYLISLGFVFDNYDPDLIANRDWTLSAKEFMFWTRHNWSIGSLITLNPSSEILELDLQSIGVVDNFLNDFYEYEIYNAGGNTVSPELIDINRSFRKIVIKTVDGNESLYFVKFIYVLKEHVVIFSNRTVFNDVIYQPNTGYRQERIKSQGFRTVDWDGDYTSPGFIFDNVNIEQWQSFIDYKLGDIVAYRSFYWTSRAVHKSQEEFDATKWTKLDLIPEKSLVPNLDYRVNLISDYYEVLEDGAGISQREIARHLLGYQSRKYLEDLAEDPLMQFQIYRGYIREKGTQNSISKIFEKVSRNANESALDIQEEWAIRKARIGGVDQIKEFEVRLDKEKFLLNPQTVFYVENLPDFPSDRLYRFDDQSITIKPDDFQGEIFPKVYHDPDDLTAGYVRADQVRFVVKNLTSLVGQDIDQFAEDDHVWVTFDKTSWGAYRFVSVPLLYAAGISQTDSLITIFFNRPHNFIEGEVFATRIPFIKGFWPISRIPSPRSVSFDITEKIIPESLVDGLVDSSLYPVWMIIKSRFESYAELDKSQSALLPVSSKLWIDRNQDGLWQVVEKTRQYDFKKVLDYGAGIPLNTGRKVLYDNRNKQIIASMPGSSSVMVYIERERGLSLKQIISPPFDNYDSIVRGTYGDELALSSDNTWLVVGAPRAAPFSQYAGEFDEFETYDIDDVVLYGGTLWRAKNRIFGDGSTINVYSDDWEPADIIRAVPSLTNPGLENQGFISIYKWRYRDAAQTISEGRWELESTIVSPRPAANEFFGSSISIGADNGRYFMAVSAPGATNNTGRVYLFVYENGRWRMREDQNYRGIYRAQGPEFKLNTVKVGKTYTIASLDTTDFTLFGSSGNILGLDFIATTDGLISAGNFVVGKEYVIADLGTTNWQDFGFIDPRGPAVGRTFVATAAGAGSGKVTQGNGTVYSNEFFYPKGSIVYSEGELFQALTDYYPDGSTVSLESNDWLRLNPVNTNASLPKSVRLENDGSTILPSGLLTDLQIAEIVNTGDGFGHKVSMNYDASILVVGAPHSDGWLIANYKGPWRYDIEYLQGDIVKFDNNYYELGNIEPNLYSYGQTPESSVEWIRLAIEIPQNTGKIFIYRRNQYDIYELTQTLTADNINSFNDINSTESINFGDQFGFSLDLDPSGNLLVVSSPKADIDFQNQGVVYVLERDLSASLEYKVKQKLYSYEKYPNEFFGNDIAISPSSDKIVVGANNSQFKAITTFDFNTTVFDKRTTRFFGKQGSTGAVYVFEKKGSDYFLTEKLLGDFQDLESFGSSVSCSDSHILVGSPSYKAVIDSVTYETGIIRSFKKNPLVSSWNVIALQQQQIDIDKIQSISLYDDFQNIKLLDLDIHDPARYKILGQAEQEIKFKTPYDPAVYNTGDSESATIDSQIAWAEKHVGELWWDISKSKWINYDQGDITYRSINWAKLAEGSEIVICEWVESRFTPTEYGELADTVEGLAQNISGQPLYDNVYTVKNIYNSLTGRILENRYFFWVKDKVIIPSAKGRKLSAFGVKGLIENPSSDYPYIGVTGNDAILFFNLEQRLESPSILFNAVTAVDNSRINLVHNEYQLIAEESDDQIIPANLELKWIDSLIGYDPDGNRIPDPNLSEKQKYGILFRPRQSMFKNRFEVLKIVIERINRTLLLESFSDTADLSQFYLREPIPERNLNIYDLEIENDIDLQNVGTVRIKRAQLRANILDGEIDTIDIIDGGFGYRVAPPLIVEGNGVSAEAQAFIDTQGRIERIEVINKGKKYTQASIKVRPFSVLVRFDSTQNNLWSIYGYDDERKLFFKIRTQAYDVTRFWKFVDWWADDYNEFSRIAKEISGTYQEQIIQIELGDLVRIKEYGNGGWAVVEKISETGDNFFDRFRLVGRQNGTIQLSSDLYDISTSGIGFDNRVFYDIGLYDLENSKELRIMLNSIKEDIFVNVYRKEWKSLFFESLRYILVEQLYVDWMFKTSFVRVKNNVGNLDQKLNYKNDNLDSYIQYLNEVKPYRTTIRSYISAYDNKESVPAVVTDFDAEPYYDISTGQIEPFKTGSSVEDSYPWKFWKDNNYFSVVSITVVDGGNDYTEPPRVIVEGDGEGAAGKAFISNGRVVAVEVTDNGQKYRTAPKIALVGGNGSSLNTAKAVAIIGNSSIRTMKTQIRFDRTSKEVLFDDIEKIQTFIASGSSGIFELRYPPTRNKNEIKIFKNDEIVFSSDYEISLYQIESENQTLLQGLIRFLIPLVAGDVIEVRYVINDDILDNVNKIEKYYAPRSGMKSKNISQLMTGIDYGGVKIQGTTFDVTGGWDALPWFTDTWDSVEASADYYIVADGSTGSVTLPYVPTDGQKINIYLKRAQSGIDSQLESPVIRIDDPNFDQNLDSSSTVNPNSVMPTFVGDGSTNTIDIGTYVQTNDGDTLIFRSEDSDGAVSIKDPNIVDTLISGGDLSYTGSISSGIYSTANGLSAEDITIDGEKFISPDQVPAPEENVPGQVLDALSLRVFSKDISGPAPLSFKVTTADGIKRNYDIGLSVLENTNVIVYVDKIKKSFGTDYSVNLRTDRVEFVTAPTVGAKIEIISLGLGGVSILDYQEFVADGDTSLFLTSAAFDQTAQVLVTVNGEKADVGFVDSTDFVDSVNRTLVQFAIKPTIGSVIKIVALATFLDLDSSGTAIVKVNQQSLIYDGSTRSFDLDGFVELARGSALASTIVEINGNILPGVDTEFVVYDGTNNVLLLGQDPFELSGSILPSNIKVLVNGFLRQLIIDYDFNSITKELTVNPNRISIGDVIVVESDLRAKYSTIGNNLLIDDSVTLVEDDEIQITWFSEYPTLAITSDQYTGGKVTYFLKSTPVNSSYCWVYLNDRRLTLDIDYRIEIPRGALYLLSETTGSDSIRVVLFSSNVYVRPVAYEISKDILNLYRFRRYGIQDVKLAKTLNYYDNEIELNTTQGLYDPRPSDNIPGIVTINGEKISYFSKNGNRLSQLRRGFEGTSIAEIHQIGTPVINSSRDESIPYSENQKKYSFVADGSSLLIGSLDFVPTKSDKQRWYQRQFYVDRGLFRKKEDNGRSVTYRPKDLVQFNGRFYTNIQQSTEIEPTNQQYWAQITIPEEFGPCDSLEVFVGGRRLNKNPQNIWSEINGPYSPSSDITKEAEFSVDGVTAAIRLTEAPISGTRITIIRKTGKTWYDLTNTAQGHPVTLGKNTNPIAKFIAQKNTKLPE